MNWNIEQTSPMVSTIRINGKEKGWEQWCLLSSDRHFDNPMSRIDLQRRHLDQAKERNAFVIDVGDLFCAMQGNKDPRAQKSKVRKENMVDAYYDSLVDSGYELFKDYKDILAVIGKGNHETKIIKHNEIDLTNHLVRRLNAAGSPVIAGGYRGWVRFMFEINGSKRFSYRLYYVHGSGGSAPVTKGVIKTNRRAVVLPDADIIISGHIHESWYMEIARTRLNNQGREYLDDQLHLSIPTYKDEFSGQEYGFMVEQEASPKPLGAWWIRFFFDNIDKRVKYEFTRAK